jgi:hypothetical protein
MDNWLGWLEGSWLIGSWGSGVIPPIPSVTFGPPRRVKPKYEWKKKDIEEEIPASLLPHAFVEKLERILPEPPADVTPLESFTVNLTPIFPIVVKSQADILSSLDAQYQQELSAIMKKKQLGDLLNAVQEKYQRRIAAELEEKRRVLEDEEIFMLFN